MVYPEKTEKEVKQLILKHKLYLVGGFVSPAALRLLMDYAKQKVQRGKSLQPEEITSFHNKIEHNGVVL